MEKKHKKVKMDGETIVLVPKSKYKTLEQAHTKRSQLRSVLDAGDTDLSEDQMTQNMQALADQFFNVSATGISLDEMLPPSAASSARPSTPSPPQTASAHLPAMSFGFGVSEMTEQNPVTPPRAERSKAKAKAKSSSIRNKNKFL